MTDSAVWVWRELSNAAPMAGSCSIRNTCRSLLHVPENSVADGYLREIIGLLHQRGETLAARLAQPGRAGVGEITDFLLLQICNRYEPLLVHARRSPVFHAEQFYALAAVALGRSVDLQ